MNLGVLLGSLGSDRGAAVTSAAASSVALDASAEETSVTPGVTGGEKPASKDPKSDAAAGDVFAALLASFVSAPLPADGSAEGEKSLSATPQEPAPLSVANSAPTNSKRAPAPVLAMTFETPKGAPLTTPPIAAAVSRGETTAPFVPRNSAAPFSSALLLEAPAPTSDETRLPSLVSAPVLETKAPVATLSVETSSTPLTVVEASALDPLTPPEDASPSRDDVSVDKEPGPARASSEEMESRSAFVDSSSDAAADSSAGHQDAKRENAPKSHAASPSSHASKASEARSDSLAKETSISLPEGSTSISSASSSSAPVSSIPTGDGESHRLAPWSAAPAPSLAPRSESLAPGNAPPAVDLREPLSWTPQIRLALAAKAREFLDRGVTEIRLTLDPPSLGRLRIKLEVGEGRVAAHLVASSAHAAALLERDRGELVRAFEAQGIDEVSVRIGTEGDAPDREPANEFEDAAPSREVRLEERESEKLLRRPARTRRARIDLVV